jgi:hypothetical protein
MNSFQEFCLCSDRCKQELAAFEELLVSNRTLRENQHILPFFRNNAHIAALVGSYNPKILRFDRLATEFDLYGNHVCDLVIGDSVTHNFCFVEFEDASPQSIFVKKKGRRAPEWSRRLDHGFDQILDWFHLIEDHQGTHQNRLVFGTEFIQYIGLLVIGRKEHLTPYDLQKLDWRSEEVRVGARQVCCITFDDLYDTLRLKLDVLCG